jgi:hypothetical protein
MMKTTRTNRAERLASPVGFREDSRVQAGCPAEYRGVGGAPEARWAQWVAGDLDRDPEPACLEGVARASDQAPVEAEWRDQVAVACRAVAG